MFWGLLWPAFVGYMLVVAKIQRVVHHVTLLLQLCKLTVDPWNSQMPML